MQTRNHTTVTVHGGTLNLSSWGSESIHATDASGDQITIAGISNKQLRDAITSYVRSLRHASTSEQTSAKAWLELLADSVRETVDRLPAEAAA